MELDVQRLGMFPVFWDAMTDYLPGVACIISALLYVQLQECEFSFHIRVIEAHSLQKKKTTPLNA